MKVDETTLRLIEPFLKQNLELVRTLDELKNLSLIAYTTGDMNWLHKICASIEMVENEAFKA